MIRTYLILMAILSLSGCTIYQSIGDSFGTYVSAPDGQDFQPVGYRWDYEHTALLYVYRPQSQWSDDELEAPSVYINDERQFNIKGSAYTWYELKPGTHNLVIRRPLLGLEGIDIPDVFSFTLKTVAQLQLNARAGEVIYLRYSEVDPVEEGASGEVVVITDGPLQVVPASIALAEIKDTKMLHHGRDLLAAAPVVKEEPEVESAAEVEAETDDASEAIFGTDEEESKPVQSPRSEPASDNDWSPF